MKKKIDPNKIRKPNHKHIWLEGKLLSGYTYLLCKVCKKFSVLGKSTKKHIGCFGK